MEKNINTIAEFYITSPSLLKDSLGQAYTSYLILGRKVPKPIHRRYKDFDMLRHKMIEQWPGIYISNIPHKIIIGNTKSQIVESRMQMINHFCEKISLKNYLINSNEIQVFLNDTPDIRKDLSLIAIPTYENLSYKYRQVFLEYNDIDLSNAKEVIKSFTAYIIKALIELNTFLMKVSKVRDRYLIDHDNILKVMNEFEQYEKDLLHLNNNNDKDYATDTVLSTMNNTTKEALAYKSIQSLQLNIYDSLYLKILSNILDFEAFKEALNSINTLEYSKANMQKLLEENIQEVNLIEEGKFSIKTLFSFKSKDDFIKEYKIQQENIKKDIIALNYIINVAIWAIEKEIKEYQLETIDSYNKELRDLYYKNISVGQVNKAYYTQILNIKQKTHQ